jgi:hypothetical protein
MKAPQMTLASAERQSLSSKGGTVVLCHRETPVRIDSGYQRREALPPF